MAGTAGRWRVSRRSVPGSIRWGSLMSGTRSLISTTTRAIPRPGRSPAPSCSGSWITLMSRWACHDHRRSGASLHVPSMKTRCQPHNGWLTHRASRSPETICSRSSTVRGIFGRPGRRFPAVSAYPSICSHPAAGTHDQQAAPNDGCILRLRRIWRWQAIPCLSCRPGGAGAGCPCQGGTGRSSLAEYPPSGFPGGAEQVPPLLISGSGHAGPRPALVAGRRAQPDVRRRGRSRRTRPPGR